MHLKFNTHKSHGFLHKKRKQTRQSIPNNHIEQTHRDPNLPNIDKPLKHALQETLKSVGATHLVKVHSYPTQKQPYLNLQVQTDKGKQEIVTIDFRPKKPDNTT